MITSNNQPIIFKEEQKKSEKKVNFARDNELNECIPVLQGLRREGSVEIGTAMQQNLWHIVVVPLRPRDFDPPANLLDRRFNLTRANRNALSLVVAVIDNALPMLGKVGNEAVYSLMLPIVKQPHSTIDIPLP